MFEDPGSFRRTWLRESEFLARWHNRDPSTKENLEHFAMVLLGKRSGQKNARISALKRGCLRRNNRFQIYPS